MNYGRADAVKTRNGDGGNQLGAGTYPALLVQEVKEIDGYYGKKIIIVVEPLLPGEGPDCTPVGQTGSKSYKIEGQNADLAWGDLRGLMCVAHGIPKEKEGATNFGQLIDAAVNRKALDGRILAAEAFATTTRANQPFLKVKWAPADPADEQRARAGVQGARARFAAEQEEASTFVPPGAPDAPPVPSENFPPPGWKAHPNAAGWFCKVNPDGRYDQSVKPVKEADLRKMA